MRLLALVAALAGCGNPGLTAARQAIDAADIAAAQAAILASNADSLGTVSLSTGDDAAQAVALAWSGQWTPAGCLVVATTPATVNAVFTDCSGPYGLQHVNGSLAILFTSASTASGSTTVAATAEGVGFGANGAVFGVEAAATYQLDATHRNVTVAAQGAAVNGTGAHGTAVTQQAAYSADFAMGCITVDGGWQTVVDSKVEQLSVAKYEKCAGMCPSSGGMLVATSVGGLFSTSATTVDFDGSAQATFTGSLGRGQVPLFCP
jgi:hypothetical protein